MPYRILDDGIYHVYNRGFEHMRLFHSDRDYERILDRLQYLLQPTLNPGVKVTSTPGFSLIQLHAFCILPNHFHLILSGDASLFPSFLGNLQNSYAKYFNIKHERRGQVFEGRYNAKIIRDEEYLASCYSYVTHNTLKHELVTDIRDWPWTSYHQLFEGIIDPRLPQVTSLNLELVDYVDLDEE